MAKTISATDAARKFSDILNQVLFRGERYAIARSGKPIASLGPVGAPTQLTLGDAFEVLTELPSLGKDSAALARAVQWTMRRAPPPPKPRPS